MKTMITKLFLFGMLATTGLVACGDAADNYRDGSSSPKTKVPEDAERGYAIAPEAFDGKNERSDGPSRAPVVSPAVASSSGLPDFYVYSEAGGVAANSNGGVNAASFPGSDSDRNRDARTLNNPTISGVGLDF